MLALKVENWGGKDHEKTIMIDKSKLNIIENEVSNEMDCLINILNINNLIYYYNNNNNEEIKKYKNNMSSNI